MEPLQLETLFDVIDRLEAGQIPYMLSGSLALGFYAEPRMTRDIDIVIELQTSDAERFAALFADAFYCEAEAVHRAVTRRGMFKMIHSTGLPKVDFIIRKDTEYRRLEFSGDARLRYTARTSGSCRPRISCCPSPPCR
jgi:hypothetical protein